MELNALDLKKYSRQLILKNIGVSGQKKIFNSKILVVGAGGLGCPLILYLAYSGVGNLGIVDNDKIELSNLSRQVLFTKKDLGKFKVVTFSDKTTLEKKGDGLFGLVDQNVKEQTTVQTKIRQGFLEQSNVKSVEEMVQMIDTVRSFEAYQKMIQTIDQLDERSVNSVGRIG